jgi:hypothetical protein
MYHQSLNESMLRRVQAVHGSSLGILDIKLLKTSDPHNMPFKDQHTNSYFE